MKQEKAERARAQGLGKAREQGPPTGFRRAGEGRTFTGSARLAAVGRGLPAEDVGCPALLCTSQKAFPSYLVVLDEGWSQLTPGVFGKVPGPLQWSQ